ncbi:SDR family NAD(P)-dependent oxidoreductase [Aquirhabdus sp.]|uniref:SDR family NAD(P)-dependent oxidoreductase n=1 Tax=Aquirhabdus sp. TaxID=2824160 RepID=UPI00396CEB97
MTSSRTQQGKLSNQTVWITGASSGIGEALAIACAARGANVVLSARRLDELERVKVACEEVGLGQFLAVALDVTDDVACDQAYFDISKQMGKVDWLINNAGISQRSLISDTLTAVDRKIMEVDYFSVVNLTRKVLPDMLKRRSGKVIFISSVAGLVGTQYRASYAAAKAAVHLWANSLRAEVGGQGIGVSVVFPGFVKTNVSVAALVGDGSEQGTMDDAQHTAMSANDFAEKTVKALLANREYIVVGGAKEKVAALLSRASPTLLYKVIRRSKVT